MGIIQKAFSRSRYRASNDPGLIDRKLLSSKLYRFKVFVILIGFNRAAKINNLKITCFFRRWYPGNRRSRQNIIRRGFQRARFRTSNDLRLIDRNFEVLQRFKIFLILTRFNRGVLFIYLFRIKNFFIDCPAQQQSRQRIVTLFFSCTELRSHRGVASPRRGAIEGSRRGWYSVKWFKEIRRIMRLAGSAVGT